MRMAESKIRQIIRENDEGPSDFGGEGDYVSWDDVYKILAMRLHHETGPKGIWVKTGYRPEPGAPRGPTHMMEGNYIDLFSFISEYLSDFNVKKVVRAREPGSDERLWQIIRFMKEFESKFPGAANQKKIDDRRIGGPGPNRTKIDSPMLIPIPYFDDFKKVVLTWLTNTLTGEEREIPWPEDMRITEGRIRQIVREELSEALLPNILPGAEDDDDAPPRREDAISKKQSKIAAMKAKRSRMVSAYVEGMYFTCKKLGDGDPERGYFTVSELVQEFAAEHYPNVKASFYADPTDVHESGTDEFLVEGPADELPGFVRSIKEMFNRVGTGKDIHLQADSIRDL